MLLFFGGFSAGIIVVWIWVKTYLHRYDNLIKDGIEVYDKLNELFKNCQDLSVQTISELEAKIDKSHTMFKEITEVEEENPQKIIKKEEQKTIKKNDTLEIPPQYLAILRLKEAGWQTKDIAKEVAMGQDQVAMIVQLFYKNNTLS